MDPLIIGIVGVIALLVLLAFGIHVAIALAAVAIAGITFVSGPGSALGLTSRTFFAVASNYSFTVLPLFIIMGHFAVSSGIMGKAYNFASKWLSDLPAGLYMVTSASCALFAAATGSSAATTVAIGKTVIPEMEKHGYDRRLALGCVAASGTLGVLIPPSIPMVIYGIITEESIGRLLIAGVIPGVLSALIYMVGMFLLVRFKPSLGPPAARYEWKERFRTIPGIWGVVLLFGIVIGGIYGGVFTPTEAGAWGAFASIMLVVIATKKRFFNEAKKAGRDAAVTLGMIFFIFMAAVVFSRFMILAGVTDSILAFVHQGGFTPLTVLSFFIFISVIMGMFMSAGAALILVAPMAHSVLVPLGYDPIWLGVIMIKMFELAVITPPVGSNVFVIKALVPDMPVEQIFRGIAPFAVMDLLTVAILIAFPQISLWLPTIAFG